MNDYNIGTITHTINRRLVKNIETCQQIYIPATSEVKIIKRVKIKTGYLCTIKWQDGLYEMSSFNLFTQKDWERFSYLKTELAKHGVV